MWRLFLSASVHPGFFPLFFGNAIFLKHFKLKVFQKSASVVTVENRGLSWLDSMFHTEPTITKTENIISLSGLAR